MTALQYYDQPRAGSMYYQDYLNGMDCGAVDEIHELLLKNFQNSTHFKNATLADLGSGPATSFPVLVEKINFKKVFAIDGVAAMLEYIPQVFKRNDIEIVTGVADLDKDSLPIKENVVDMAICCSVTSGLCKLDNLFIETSRILKKNGLFAFNIVLHKDSFEEKIVLNDSEFGFYAYSGQEIRKLVNAANFRFVDKAILRWSLIVGDIKTFHYVILLQKIS